LRRVQWTGKAASDVIRLHEFLKSGNATAAARVVKSLMAAPNDLLENPLLGERLEEFHPREIRRLLGGRYEVRYEIVETTIFVLRVGHTREAR